MNYPTVKQINENTLIIYFGDQIQYDTPVHIAQFIEQLNQWPKDLIIDLTPSYTSLLIQYNIASISANEIIKKITTELHQSQSKKLTRQSKRIEIPVYYSPDSGLDLVITADRLEISIEELIKRHSEKDYTVFALGFSPGLAFMGIVDEALQLPRLATPRTMVPSGSVAIAEKQTCIYPSPTPGGWNLLGRTPIKLFDSTQNPPTIYKIGDIVNFIPIQRDDYINLGGDLLQ